MVAADAVLAVIRSDDKVGRQCRVGIVEPAVRLMVLGAGARCVHAMRIDRA